MALTEVQKITLFEILEVPYDDSVDEPYGDFKLNGISHEADNIEYQLYAKIINRLNSLTTAVESKLIAYLTKWEDLDVTVAAIDGGIGSLTGVSFNPLAERKVIQSRVKIMIPVMKYIHEISVDAQNQSSRSICTKTCR